MNKALKGILATYGVEETVTNLVRLAEYSIAHCDKEPFVSIKDARKDIPNDVDFLAYLMECHQVDDGNGEMLLNDDPAWRFEKDKLEFEKDADNIRVERFLWVEE